MVAVIGRHATFRPRRRAHPVFASKSGRRGLIVAVVLVVLTAGLALAIARAGQLATAAPQAPAQHGDVAYTRQLADAMAACGRTRGEVMMSGRRGIPIIGNGVFRRVVEVRSRGGGAYAVDPFSGRTVVSELTPLEVHNTQGCRYALDEFGQVPPGVFLLTFDDGPSSTWTPQLLAVLSAYHVRATFFSVGVSIMAAPDVFRLVTGSGNVVGNHTVTHPELDRLSPASARNQIVENAHIMATVGRYQTRLFRPPYGGSNSEGAGSIRANVYSTLVAQQLGYTEVGFTIDSDDYAYRPGSVIPVPAFGGPGLPGELIVMHDTAGKNDSSTVRLTERIIQKAQALGYRFMTVDQLLRQQGEPAVAGRMKQQEQPSLGDRAGYVFIWARRVLLRSGLQTTLTVATYVILGFGVLWIVRALYGGARQYRAIPAWHPKLVSVLIAAKDEKEVIRATIESVFAYRYPFSLQVVVVNDGSTDGEGGTAGGPGGTRAILDELAARYREPSRRLEVIHLPRNVGKTAAWDLAFRTRIRGEVCAAFDADTRLAGPDTIPNLVRHFRDPKVGAVAGYVKAGNVTHGPWRWLLYHFQQAEYNLGIALMRVAQGRNGIMIVPGACSAWRTSVMRQLGMPDDTLGEDANAGLELREAGYTVVQDIRAVALTQVPDTMKGIARQWTRWTFGMVQNIWKHKAIMVQPGKYGGLTWVMWYTALSLVIPIALLPLSYGVTILAAAAGNWPGLVLFLAVFTGFRLIQNLTAMVVLREWSWDPVTAVFYRFINDPLQIYLAYRVVFAVVTGRLISWRGTRAARAATGGSPLKAA